MNGFTRTLGRYQLPYLNIEDSRVRVKIIYMGASWTKSIRMFLLRRLSGKSFFVLNARLKFVTLLRLKSKNFGKGCNE